MRKSNVNSLSLDRPPVFAVPSVHWLPFFAGQVLARAAKVEPDAVAVELVPEMLAPFIEAVKRFPRLSGLVGGGDNLCPVIPTDSIAQAVRFALEKGLPIYAVDCPRVGVHTGRSDRIVPPAVGDRYGLTEYYRLAAPLVEPSLPGEPDDLREYAMAGRLKLLAQDHRRILFVCGLAHWEAIKGHLDTGAAMPAPHAPDDFEMVHLTSWAAYYYTGQMPYSIAAFEMAANKSAFAEKDVPAQLYLETSREQGHRLSPGDHFHLNQYALNLATIERTLSPSLFELTLSAKANVSDKFGIEVHEKGLSYPWDEESQGLPVLDVDANDNENLGGMTKRFSLTGGWGKHSISRVKNMIASGDREKRHPEGDDVGRNCRREDWGRFKDEAVKEERFLEYLRRFARQRLALSEWESGEFTTGIKDGLDTRATLRDLRGRIWVKTLLKDPGEVGAVYIDWGKAEGEESAYCYASHRGMGFYRNRGEVNPGVDACEWTAMISFFRCIKAEKLFELYDRWGDQRPSRESLADLVVMHAPGNLILFVSPKPPISRHLNAAASHGKRILHIPASQVPRQIFFEAPHHHIYWRD